MGVYVDNHGRQWQTNEVEMEEELKKDAEGNVIPLLNEIGLPIRDPITGLQKFQPRIDPKTGKPFMRPVMTWAHRDPDANTLKWLASHQYSDEFGDAAVEHNVNLRLKPYHAFAQRYTRARGEHGLKMIGTLQALGLGGMYQRPKMGVYVDNNGRQWQNQRSRDGGRTGEGRRALVRRVL
jgi:hypothetical protein